MMGHWNVASASAGCAKRRLQSPSLRRNESHNGMMKYLFRTRRSANRQGTARRSRRQLNLPPRAAYANRAVILATQIRVRHS